ncbi:MAG: hypothetical protein IPP78_01125 [Holophagaceae bacterium]|nr:hypothetical protein [Holophagaceae bacterium]
MSSDLTPKRVCSFFASLGRLNHSFTPVTKSKRTDTDMDIIPWASPKPDSFLFDRARGTHHWFAALDALTLSAEPGHVPLAQNWRMDVRVDAAREVHLDGSGCFPAGGSGKGFDAAIRDYQSHYLCRSTTATPCSSYVEIANQGNLIPFDERPARNHYLLHLASVKNLLRFVLKPSVPGKVDFEMAIFQLAGIRLPDNPGNSDAEKLVNALQARGLDEVKEFAHALSDALGENEPHWWAAFAHEIGDLRATNDWTDAVRKTGQGHIEPGEWLMAWHYSPELAGRLYRPTVAEAGTCAFHFPSPPQASYGITMPLVAGSPAVRELIHPPLKGDISAEACIGFGKAVDSPVSVSGQHDMAVWFRTRRHEHGRSLALNQPPSIPAQAWLLRHAILP